MDSGHFLDFTADFIISGAGFSCWQQPQILAHTVITMSLGSWLRNHPRLLERAYKATNRLFVRLHPLIKRLGYARADRWLHPGEEFSKKIIFDCRMCGQCILHSTGMTCPMTCPKNLRNGPCGGVRNNGHCEVKPEMKCIWVEAFERSRQMATYGHEITTLQPPVNRQLEGSSAWINMLTGVDKQTPAGWVSTSEIIVANFIPKNHSTSSNL